MNSKITFSLAFFLVLLSFACNNGVKPEEASSESDKAENPELVAQQVDIEGFTNENGVMIEEVDNSFRKSAKELVLQTADNKIFKPGRVFKYDYYYLNEKNEKRMCVLSPPDPKIPSRKAYYYMPPSDLSELALMQVHITVLPGLGLIENVRPDFTKTTAKYSYKLYNEMAGVREQSPIIENEQNVWMTPPRFKIFRMLEFNPYPYIKTPFEIGNKWTWEHEVKTRWGDAQWLVLHEPLPNTYTYEITDLKKMGTAMGELDCYVVEAEAKNEFGEAYLTSYFNPEYGFVRLEYTNLHYTKMVFDLVEVEELEEMVLH